MQLLKKNKRAAALFILTNQPRTWRKLFSISIINNLEAFTGQILTHLPLFLWLEAMTHIWEISTSSQVSHFLVSWYHEGQIGFSGIPFNKLGEMRGINSKRCDEMQSLCNSSIRAVQGGVNTHWHRGETGRLWHKLTKVLKLELLCYR